MEKSKLTIEFTYPVAEAGGSMLAHALAVELQRRGAAVTVIDDIVGEQTLRGNVIDCLDCSHMEIDIVKCPRH